MNTKSDTRNYSEFRINLEQLYRRVSKATSPPCTLGGSVYTIGLFWSQDIRYEATGGTAQSVDVE